MREEEVKEIRELADRIDKDQLWQLGWLMQQQLSQEQRDQLWAGIHLRRYAAARGEVREKLKEGAEYIRGYKLGRMNNGGTDRYGCGDAGWHRAINSLGDKMRAEGSKEWPRMMYVAKMVADEVPRMIMLFEAERKGDLPGAFKMWGHDPAPAELIKDNHLRCALGKECRTCPYLGALDAETSMTPEARDEAKAWTCATHVLMSGRGEDHLQQILFDKTDDAFERRMVRGA